MSGKPTNGFASDDALFLEGHGWDLTDLSYEHDLCSWTPGRAGAGSLLERMEEDKMLLGGDNEDDDNYLEASSNMRDLLEMAQVEEVTPEEESSTNDNHAFSAALEEFLLSNEHSEYELDETKVCPLTNHHFSDDELKESQDMIDALFEDLVRSEQSQRDVLCDQPGVISSGKEVSPTPSNVIVLDASSLRDSQSNAQPEPPPTKKRRSAGDTVRRRFKLCLEDRKQRKKLQNVVAARRYRDKKKTEQQLIDDEIQALEQHNSQLKSVVAEKENEVKTMKKLLVELGLIGVPIASSAGQAR